MPPCGKGFLDQAGGLATKNAKSRKNVNAHAQAERQVKLGDSLCFSWQTAEGHHQRTAAGGSRWIACGASRGGIGASVGCSLSGVWRRGLKKKCKGPRGRDRTGAHDPPVRRGRKANGNDARSHWLTAGHGPAANGPQRRRSAVSLARGRLARPVQARDIVATRATARALRAATRPERSFLRTSLADAAAEFSNDFWPPRESGGK